MMKALIVSAFTKDGQGGNKAGVIKGPSLTREEMQQIAAKLGFSETVFISPSRQADWKLEYFTPTDEVPLCGHATIAAFGAMDISGEYTIETKAGILRIRKEKDLIFMEQNLPEFYQVVSEEDIPMTDVRKDLPARIVSTGLKDLLVPITSEEALDAIRPDLPAIKEISRKEDAVGIHAFALSSDAGIDAVCRDFAPLVGINEESATGTASCALAGYLSEYVEKKNTYTFEQGKSMGQTSRITVTLSYTEDAITEIFVGGTADILEEVNIEI